MHFDIEKVIGIIESYWQKDTKLTYERIAKSMGVTPLTLRKIMSGKGVIRMQTKMKILNWIAKECNDV